MRNKAVIAAFVLALLPAGRAVAAEPVPGGSCAGLTASSFQWAGGPENNGVVNGMFCNGSTWSGIISFKSGGSVGIGTATPADTVHIYGSSAMGAGLTISTPGTGIDQQSTINLVTKGSAGATLGAAGVQGWQIWGDADANTYGPAGGANAFGIGYADGVGGIWHDTALTITPGNLVGIWNPTPQTDFDVGRAFALSGGISPAQLTANQNNYNPAASGRRRSCG